MPCVWAIQTNNWSELYWQYTSPFCVAKGSQDYACYQHDSILPALILSCCLFSEHLSLSPRFYRGIPGHCSLCLSHVTLWLFGSHWAEQGEIFLFGRDKQAVAAEEEAKWSRFSKCEGLRHISIPKHKMTDWLSFFFIADLVVCSPIPHHHLDDCHHSSGDSGIPRLLSRRLIASLRSCLGMWYLAQPASQWRKKANFDNRLKLLLLFRHQLQLTLSSSSTQKWRVIWKNTIHLPSCWHLSLLSDWSF